MLINHPAIYLSGIRITSPARTTVSDPTTDWSCSISLLASHIRPYYQLTPFDSSANNIDVSAASDI